MAADMNEGVLARVARADAIIADPFSVLRELSILINRAAASGDYSAEAQQAILYALENGRHFGRMRSVLMGLVRATGLYPYLDEELLLQRDLLAYEAHRPLGIADVVFHKEQAEVYSRLVAGESVILSAPTSFGKSLIIDALIASNRYRNVVIVVPTIALIDETRRRIASRFSRDYKLITHSSQARDEKNVFVMTQERVLDVEWKVGEVDLFVVDEFYKLDPRRDSDRSMLLNQAFYSLVKTGAQFYMLGPSINGVGERFQEVYPSRFMSTSYATVVTEQVYVESNKTNAIEKLTDLCRTLTEPTLIYCASPASARRVASALAGVIEASKEDATLEAAEWIAENYHPDWALVRALKHGIGIHHGKVPRSLSQYLVRAFNEGSVRYLVCTSTLIEGVNTKAKNVIIFDNRVATKKFDFFTFNNIRGRSGRMFEHFVGKVFVFNAPPQNDLPLVSVPLVEQGEDAPDSLLIQLDAAHLSDRSKQRIQELEAGASLSFDVLRGNTGIDPRSQMALADELRRNAAYYGGALDWRGFPEWSELEVACELIWKYFVAQGKMGGVYSGRQLAFRVDRLKKARSIKKLILKELAAQDSPDADAAVEDVLDFIRTWATFYFPRYLMALERIQAEVFRRRAGHNADYSAFSANIETMFSTAGLLALDEYGIPLQVAEQIADCLGRPNTVDEAVDALARLPAGKLSLLGGFERSLVEEAMAGVQGGAV